MEIWDQGISNSCFSVLAQKFSNGIRVSTQDGENFDIGSDKSVVPEQEEEKELWDIEMVGKVVMLLGGTGATGRSILAGTTSPIYGECQSQSAKGFGPAKRTRSSGRIQHATLTV